MLTVIFSIIGSFQLFTEPSLLNTIAPDRDQQFLHAELLRVQRRVHQPGPQLRGRYRVPARTRDRRHLVRRPTQYRTKGAPGDEPPAQARRTSPPTRRGAADAGTRPIAVGAASCSRSPVALRAVLHGSAVVAVRLVDEGQLRPVLDVRAVVRLRTSLFDNLRTCSPSRRPLHSGGSLNTVIYSVMAALGATLLSTMAGYAFAKYDFPGKKVLFSVVLGAIMIPLTALALPTYLLFSTGRSHRHALGRHHSVARQPVRGVPHARLRRGRHPRHAHRGGARRWRRGVPDLLAGGSAHARDLAS